MQHKKRILKQGWILTAAYVRAALWHQFYNVGRAAFWTEIWFKKKATKISKFLPIHCSTTSERSRLFFFFKVPRLRLFLLPTKATCTWRRVRSTGGMTVAGVNRGTPGNPLFLCHFVHHKPYMDWPDIEPGSPRWEPGDQLAQPWHCLTVWTNIIEVHRSLKFFSPVMELVRPMVSEQILTYILRTKLNKHSFGAVCRVPYR